MSTASAGRRTTMRRVVVVGTAGTGKTTFAARLAGRLGVPHVELDALYWEENWAQADLDRFRERVERAVSEEVWVVDGNYHAVRDLVWPRADTLVWLDYRLPLILWRLVRRTARRVFTREELWNGNRERFLVQVATRDSILWWALRTYRRRRRNYPQLLTRPEHAHLAVARLRSPRAMRRWAAGVDRSGASGR